MKCLTVFYALIVTAIITSSPGDTRKASSRVVTTKYGAVRGHVVTLPNRHLQPVEVFLGVPYASAPIGSLRFMHPVTPPHWRGVRTADDFGPVCPQKLPNIKNETEALKRMPAGRLEYLKKLLPFLHNQSEDCLYLNIYTPANGGREGVYLPVMMYIHGESYEWNSGNPYDGSVLASFGNVVVITFNYRLGVLGFLPTLDDYARGNYGIMDQVAALHWIRENIAEFGGDARNITIFGHGYGAACVNLLMLSPMAKGLFHRAIMQSGSALSSWALAPNAISYAHELARKLGCPIQKSSELVDCMREKSVEDIMKVQLDVPEHLTSFGPTVDGTVIPKEPSILMEDSNNLYGQYDLLFGVTRIESYFQFSSHEDKSGIEPDRRDRLLRTLVRNLFTYHLQEIFLTIVNEYTDWTKPVQHPINVLDGTADALGDALVVAPLIRTGNYHSHVQLKTYFYVFAYQSEEGNYSQRMGCIHGEDLPYVFGAPLIGSLSYFNRNYTKSEMALSEAVMTYWTNFAKVGDPNIHAHEIDSTSERGRGRFDRFMWPRYEDVHQKYLMIAMKPKVRDHYHAHRLSLWLQLIPKLHQAGSTVTSLQHHRLQDHDNLLTYDGHVREVLYPPPPSPTSTISQIPGISIPTPKGNGNESSIPDTPPPTSDHPTAQVPNTSESMAVMMQYGRYSTALSVTIAVGCSLLILNVLIFAGVYYQRDKNRLEAKLQKRNYKVHKPNDGEPNIPSIGTNKTSIRAPPPSPAGQSQIYPATQPIQAESINNVPPKVPPKPTLSPPQSSVPETQPLLPCGAVRTPLVRAVNQQEMRV